MSVIKLNLRFEKNSTIFFDTPIFHYFQIAALEILSGVCLFADGSGRVLEAFTRASTLLGERTRFQVTD